MPDGSIKGDAPVSGPWTTETNPVAYNGANSFVVSNANMTPIYIARRALYLDQLSDQYGYVVSSTFDGTNTIVTTTCTVDTGLAQVDYGQDTYSAPQVDRVDEFYTNPVFYSGNEKVLAIATDGVAVFNGANQHYSRL